MSHLEFSLQDNIKGKSVIYRQTVVTKTSSIILGPDSNNIDSRVDFKLNVCSYIGSNCMQ